MSNRGPENESIEPIIKECIALGGSRFTELSEALALGPNVGNDLVDITKKRLSQWKANTQ